MEPTLSSNKHIVSIASFCLSSLSPIYKVKHLLDTHFIIRGQCSQTSIPPPQLGHSMRFPGVRKLKKTSFKE